MGGGNDSNVQRSGTRRNKDEQDPNKKDRQLFIERNEVNVGQANKDPTHFNLPQKQLSNQSFFTPQGTPQMMESNPGMYNMNSFMKDPQSTLEYQCRVQHQQIQQQQYQLQQLQHLQLQLQYQLQLQQQQYHQQLEMLQHQPTPEQSEAKRPENGSGDSVNDSKGNRLGGNDSSVAIMESHKVDTNVVMEHEANKEVMSSGNERASSKDEKRKDGPEKIDKTKRRKEASKERKDYRKNVEKKRRAKISSAIDEFRNVLPSGADKVKKALVLELAVDYIKQLKTEYEGLIARNKHLLELNKSLRAQREEIMQSSQPENSEKRIPNPTANTSLSTGE